MQTFMPYPSYTLTALCLDSQRLNKQITEAGQIFDALSLEPYSWSSHPTAKMWAGFEGSLLEYRNCLILEWLRRGGNNSRSLMFYKDLEILNNCEKPNWFGNYEFHSSHRSALLWKSPFYYKRFGWPEIPEYNYVWPISNRIVC